MSDTTQKATLHRFFRIGATENTSTKEAESHRFLIMMGVLMSGGGLLWGTTALVFGLYLPSIIPYGYVVLTILNFTCFSICKNFSVTRFFQVLISLCLPFLFQWALGGFSSSGSIMLWAMLALTGSMTFEKLKSSIKWLVAYLLLVAVSSFIDHYCIEYFALKNSQPINTLFFGLNIGVVSGVVFGLLFFFKSKLEQREIELLETHKQLQSSEEELRQNSEELMSINENLEQTQGELRGALQKEQAQTKELEKMNERMKFTNQALQSSEKALFQNGEKLMVANNELKNIHDQLKKSLKDEILSKKKLERTNAKLKDAQTKLVQSEKMASLGEMTTGLAHEINNPLNFISGGVQSLELVSSELLSVFYSYRGLEKAESEEERQQKLIELKNLKEDLGFKELLEDFNGLLGDISKGSSMATEVVRSLRNFSRKDDGKRQLTDIHEGLNATLVILRNKLSDGVEIIKNYDEHISQIQCYPVQLNQVFLNLISNAIDAVDVGGKINISTRNFEEYVEIHIADSGTGIAPKDLDSIFDPFYTTKKMGEGTGLGLSISKRIIDQHKGTITVSSTEGEGTEFVIALPKEVKLKKKQPKTDQSSNVDA